MPSTWASLHFGPASSWASPALRLPAVWLLLFPSLFARAMGSSVPHGPGRRCAPGPFRGRAVSGVERLPERHPERHQGLRCLDVSNLAVDLGYAGRLLLHSSRRQGIEDGVQDRVPVRWGKVWPRILQRSCVRPESVLAFSVSWVQFVPSTRTGAIVLQAPCSVICCFLPSPGANVLLLLLSVPRAFRAAAPPRPSAAIFNTSSTIPMSAVSDQLRRS